MIMSTQLGEEPVHGTSWLASHLERGRERSGSDGLVDEVVEVWGVKIVRFRMPWGMFSKWERMTMVVYRSMVVLAWAGRG